MEDRAALRGSSIFHGNGWGVYFGWPPELEVEEAELELGELEFDALDPEDDPELPPELCDDPDPPDDDPHEDDPLADDPPDEPAPPECEELPPPELPPLAEPPE